MKALQILGVHSFDIVDVELAKPREDQATVQIEIVSTCPRWDMHMMGGKDMMDASKSPEYPLPPGWPGHEMAGTVVAVGSQVNGLKVGDRVAALEHIGGYGAYAQFLNYKEDELIVLPDSISWKQAVSFELLKCVLIGLRQFGDLQGRSMLISGLGPAGMLALQAAKLLGASDVTAVDINRDRVRFVNELQLGTAIHSDDLGDTRFDMGYDCVGAAASVQYVLDRVDDHVVIFGVLKGEVHYGANLWLKGTKLESYRYRRFDATDRELLLDLVGNRNLNTECLQTHHIPFYRYGETVDLLSRQEAIKVYAFPAVDFVKAGKEGR